MTEHVGSIVFNDINVTSELTCSCGWEEALGYADLPLSVINDAWAAHLNEQAPWQ